MCFFLFFIEKLITFTPTACINTFVPWIPKANTEIQSVVEAITEAEEKLTNGKYFYILTYN